MKTNRILLETILLALVAVGGMLLFPQAKALFALIPPVYLLVERHLRGRSWTDLGFRFSTFWADLRANWVWFVLAGFIVQPLTGLLASSFAPAYLRHVIERLPFPQDINWPILVLVLAVSLLFEEMTFRVLIQGRLTPFTGTGVAIAITSVLFAVAHFNPGTPGILAIDLATIFIDSILYGIIYARSNNLILVWAAHLLGDILGMLFLLSL